MAAIRGSFQNLYHVRHQQQQQSTMALAQDTVLFRKSELEKAVSRIDHSIPKDAVIRSIILQVFTNICVMMATPTAIRMKDAIESNRIVETVEFADLTLIQGGADALVLSR
ncbi:hypothetical protein PC129_g5352 [Phytophthora cactorum]|uniref:Uncharacterized protein n=1 Tax=Phytophthora cactorum TaxID=29920 RepID=A0A329RRM7_9STRA|nr:hypothetical protein Pcac1_g3415 [Phytophthora cactorum]KAG2820782.1 hypothetical protein PC112_g11630 [Phytophthora cactorum]KAG2822955.1 hypothetical protein PC111_g10427 [Phytophthora cactorum]KAG2855756.1 hypothetical protein PC113_g12164 [Phytophthora cactorum]KAG2902234.1 hypothetical protein PC114_g12815 [Phytophthora cactorum]